MNDKNKAIKDYEK